MDLNARLAPLRDLDPDTLSEPELRAAVPLLLALAEECVAGLQEARVEIQRLKDEVARLKGQKGKPTFPTGRPARLIEPVADQGDHSSEAERRELQPRKTWKKSTKLDRISVDRDQECRWEGPLPADAQFKGYEAVIVQDLVLRTDNVRFRRAKYYAPSTGKTYLAPLPPGYEGQFGPGVKTLALSLVYGAHLSMPLLHTFLSDAGTLISRGQVANLVTGKLETFHTEAREVLHAGLCSSPWQHLDVTPTRVDGQNYACHVLGNPLFAHYHTTPRQDRGSVVDVLRGGAPRSYRLDAIAFAHLSECRLPAWIEKRLAHFPREITWTEAEFFRMLDLRLPLLRAKQRKHVEESAAIAAYRADPDWPVVQCLVADDAGQFRGVTPELALCWIHDGRHYKKLQPVFASHRWQSKRFAKHYWAFYRDLLSYQKDGIPSPEVAARREAAFGTLFTTTDVWAGLQTCIDRTRANKEKLLRVLQHPELPLHNNSAELIARRRARKRDVSFGPRSQAGLRAWDTFEGLAATAQKHGLGFWAYLHDRITRAGAIPPLAGLIAARATTMRLGDSWSAA